MELHGEEEELKQEAQQEEKIGISEQKEVVGECLGYVEYIKESQVEEPSSKKFGGNIKETSNIARVNNELKEIDREVDSITSDFLPTSINSLDDPVEPFSSTLESKVEEDLKPPRPNASEELEEVFQATNSPTYDDSESTYDPFEFEESFPELLRLDDEPPTSRRSRARAVAKAARPSSSTAAPAPSSAPKPTYLLVQHLLRFMERFECRVMRRLDRLDQATASQGIELPPLPESPASDEQDPEEEHGEEPIQQEAPPEMQTTTPEVQHDISEPQPVPPPVPPPEPEHEPQPGAIVDPHSELP
ncbi:protein TsetseEP-like [Arachis ipaensis]|uniref:protein TsetseEP-like n=1 Tax=Arachis ipaensis TaxID=130454 RepID=UPI0007AEF5E0|nr:protein TsetseEP-like [Arachis ipaensis]